jgi:hypothetical protein
MKFFNLNKNIIYNLFIINKKQKKLLLNKNKKYISIIKKRKIFYIFKNSFLKYKRLIKQIKPKYSSQIDKCKNHLKKDKMKKNNQIFINFFFNNFIKKYNLPINILKYIYNLNFNFFILSLFIKFKKF